MLESSGSRGLSDGATRAQYAAPLRGGCRSRVTTGRCRGVRELAAAGSGSPFAFRRHRVADDLAQLLQEAPVGAIGSLAVAAD